MTNDPALLNEMLKVGIVTGAVYGTVAGLAYSYVKHVTRETNSAKLDIDAAIRAVNNPPKIRKLRPHLP